MPYLPDYLYLLMLSNRYRAKMWAKVAEEADIPLQIAEAMHWQFGKNELARRALVSKRQNK
jgi:hypothetical protein